VARRRLVTDHTTGATLTLTDLNGIHTNAGSSGSVTLTLPAAAAARVGAFLDVCATDAQILIVATAASDTLIGANDVDFDSITWGTASNIIGNSATFICISSTKWFCQQHVAAAATTILTQTFTD
jgi:hypothetical protein